MAIEYFMNEDNLRLRPSSGGLPPPIQLTPQAQSQSAVAPSPQRGALPPMSLGPVTGTPATAAAPASQSDAVVDVEADPLLSDKDKWAAFTDAMLQMTAAASQPGATALGAFAQGGQQGMASIRNLEKQALAMQLQKAEQARQHRLMDLEERKVGAQEFGAETDRMRVGAALRKAASETGQPIKIGDKLVDPKTFKVLGDYSDNKQPVLVPGEEIAPELAGTIFQYDGEKYSTLYSPETRSQNLINIRTRDGKTIVLDENDPESLAKIRELGGFIVGDAEEQAGNVSLSGGQRDELRGEIDFLSRTQEKLEQVLNTVKEDPAAFGLIGTGRSLFQRGVGIAEDLSSTIPGVAGLVETISPRIQEDKETGRISQEAMDTYFNPDLSEIPILENSLAYAIARARKGTGRLNAQDIENAKKEVNLQGLTSARDVQARLNLLLEELGGAKQDLQGRLSAGSPDQRGGVGGSGPPAGAPVYVIDPETGDLVPKGG